jgi:hypothetical protein
MGYGFWIGKNLTRIQGSKKHRIRIRNIDNFTSSCIFGRMQAKVLHNSEKCAETEQKRAGRAAQKLARLHKRLATAGIQYDIKLS